jgi:ABC-type transporter Mla subunit MlaD
MAADPTTDTERELAELRARVAELEEELVDVTAKANAAVAAAQDRTYWLDRWHIDLNALMRRRGASEFRAALRAVRTLQRATIELRRLLESERKGIGEIRDEGKRARRPGT